MSKAEQGLETLEHEFDLPTGSVDRDTMSLSNMALLDAVALSVDLGEVAIEAFQ